MYYGCIHVPFQRVRTSRLLLHSPQLAPQMMLLFQAGDGKKKHRDPSNSRTGQPIAAVLAHSHGTAFVMCYTASYIFVSLGGVPAVGLVTEKTSTTRD